MEIPHKELIEIRKNIFFNEFNYKEYFKRKFPNDDYNYKFSFLIEWFINYEDKKFMKFITM